jgi:molybdopterin-guanine dinucleotide biosynthesis protein A
MVKIKLIEEQEFHFLDPGMESFINVNTPEQLRLVKQRRPLH